jgi:hypothetical protein
MAQQTASFGVSSAEGKPSIIVPWSTADRCHSRLRKCGLGSTLVVDCLDRTARLELWPGVEAEEALAALSGCVS